MKKPYIVLHQFGILPDMEKSTGFTKAIMLKKWVIPAQASLGNDKPLKILGNLFRDFRIHRHKSQIVQLFPRKCLITFWNQKLMKDYIQRETHL